MYISVGLVSAMILISDDESVMSAQCRLMSLDFFMSRTHSSR